MSKARDKIKRAARDEGRKFLLGVALSAIPKAFKAIGRAFKKLGSRIRKKRAERRAKKGK